MGAGPCRAGNETNHGFHAYTYDAEGRIAQIDGGATSVVYDAFGNRVEENLGSPGVTDWVFGPAGKPIWGFTAAGGMRSEVYAGAGHLATYKGTAVYFDYGDQVSSMRIHTAVPPPAVTPNDVCQNLAFGDGLDCAGFPPNKMHFTDQPMDVDGLTHFQFRDLSTTQGRWVVPDPAGLAAVDPASPQTWNRYAYVANNPLSAVDPLGLRMNPVCVMPDGGAGCGGGGDATDQGNYGFDAKYGAGDVLMDGQAAPAWLGDAVLRSGAGVICQQCQPGQMVDAANQIWGWVQNTPNSGVSSPSSQGASFVPIAYWGVVGSVTNMFQQFSPMCVLFCGRNGNDVFEKNYPGETPPTTSVSAVDPPSAGTISALCTIDALNANNGLGLPTGGPPSSSDSIANGIVLQQRTTVGIRTLNPGAPNIAVLGPLAAPGLFVQASYNNCVEGH